jgi:hypothetical protein
MTRENDVRKTLGTWLGKAKKLGEPPGPNEARNTLSRQEAGGGLAAGDDLTQLNFKIPHSTKKRIKALALRDNITLLVMLDRMLALYEREYGKLGK